MPYQDEKDILLKYLLHHDIKTGGPEGDFRPPTINITGVESFVKIINDKAGTDWIELSKNDDGISAKIRPLYKKDAKNYLTFGGFTRDAYEAKITDDEKLNLLIYIRKQGGNIELSKRPEWEWNENPRIIQIVNALIATGFLLLKDGSDTFYKIELKSLGAQSAIANQLLPKPDDPKKWYEHAFVKWLGGIIATLVAAYLGHLFWPGSC